MKVYMIVDIWGYEYCSDDREHNESARGVAYKTKEKAYDAICREIALGDFTNGYGEPIIVDKLPTIEELEDLWTIDQGPEYNEYNGYKIEEVEVIE